MVGLSGVSGGNLYVLMRRLWTSEYRQNCLMEIAQGTAVPGPSLLGILGKLLHFPKPAFAHL